MEFWRPPRDDRDVVWVSETWHAALGRHMEALGREFFEIGQNAVCDSLLQVLWIEAVDADYHGWTSLEFVLPAVQLDVRTRLDKRFGGALLKRVQVWSLEVWVFGQVVPSSNGEFVLQPWILLSRFHFFIGKDASLSQYH